MNIIYICCDSIFLLGDVHGRYDILFNSINNGYFINSIIISVGDFGVGFKGDNNKNLNKINLRLGKCNSKLFIVRGNHDNPAWFKHITDKKLKIPKYKNITFVEDYTILNVVDVNFKKLNILCVGGAFSIDRSSRTNNIDWWEDEIFVYDKNKIDEIKNTVDCVDIICSHAVPQFAYPQIFGNKVIPWLSVDSKLKEDLTVERFWVNQLYADFKDFGLKRWYYGHYHDTYLEIIDDVRFKLLNINELEECRIQKL